MYYVQRFSVRQIGSGIWTEWYIIEAVEFGRFREATAPFWNKSIVEYMCDFWNARAHLTPLRAFRLAQS